MLAQAEPSRAHEVIVANLALLIGASVVAAGFRFVNRGTVWCEERSSELAPDWLVLCDERDRFGDGPEKRRSRYRFPRMIVEVLSPSNSGSELLAKFNAYNTSPSLELYAVIDSTRRSIWRYERAERGLGETRASSHLITPWGSPSLDEIYERSGVEA